jgi:hypothetical protein
MNRAAPVLLFSALAAVQGCADERPLECSALDAGSSELDDTPRDDGDAEADARVDAGMHARVETAVGAAAYASSNCNRTRVHRAKAAQCGSQTGLTALN